MKNKREKNSSEQLNIFSNTEDSVNNSQNSDSSQDKSSREGETSTIADYINKNEEKIEWLIQQYYPPISSFFPPERRIETELIYANADLSSLADKFSDYIFPISTRDIEDWISQFETTLHKNIAFLLLKKIQFLSRSKVIEGCVNLRSQLLNLLRSWHPIQSAFKANTSTIPEETALDSWIENHVIHYAHLPLGKGNTSQTRMQQTYELLWDVYKKTSIQHCHTVRRFEPLDFHFTQSKKNIDATAFVFMDFTNASGDTLTRNVEAINKLINGLDESRRKAWREALYVFMYIVESKNFDKTKLKEVLPNSFTISAEEMLAYNDTSVINFLSENEILEDEYQAFVKKYCMLFGNRGYNNEGFLTCHYYSCPNNTLPFLYKEKPGRWKRLFQNSQIPRAGTYH